MGSAIPQTALSHPAAPRVLREVGFGQETYPAFGFMAIVMQPRRRFSSKTSEILRDWPCNPPRNPTPQGKPAGLEL